MNLYFTLFLFSMSIIPLANTEFEFITDNGISSENQPWGNVTTRDIWVEGASEPESTNSAEVELEIEFEPEVVLVEPESEIETVANAEDNIENEVEVETLPIIMDEDVVVIGDWVQGPPLANLADALGWSDPKYFSTIRAVLLDDDNDAIWLFARGADGMEVYNYVVDLETWNIRPKLSDLNDSNNWGDSAKYYSTIRVISYYSSFWLLARNADGLQLYQYNAYSSTWAQQKALPFFSDEKGWDRVEYYSSIEAFLSSGQLWVFARGKDGEVVSKFDTDAKEWGDPLPAFEELSDNNHWSNDAKYYSTIRVLRILNNFWLFARKADGMYVYQTDSTNPSGWKSKVTGFSDFSDKKGWGDKEYYTTIQIVSLISDTETIWLFARNEFGVQTYLYNTKDSTFVSRASLPYLSDTNKWNQPQYYSTIQTVATNTSIALVGRGSDGLQYYEYSPSENDWKHVSTLTVFSDEKDWDTEKYYSTISAIYFQQKLNIVARGPDGMRVYYLNKPK